MEFVLRPARLAAPIVALLALALAPATAGAFGEVSDNGASIDYAGDPAQDALLTLSVSTPTGGTERAVVDAINDINSVEPACVEAPLNHVECSQVRPWTVRSYAFNDVITNLSLLALTAQLGAGDDTATSKDGFDHLFGEAGADALTGGPGDDELDGGDGPDVLLGGAGRDTVRGGAGNDDIDGAEDDDLLTGGDGDDYLTGAAGSDTITANAGDDLLEGGDGADALSGAEGNDRLSGGTGADSLSGGDGVDRVDYSERTAAQPLRISLDDVNNDGENGEGDNVTSDVEEVVGGGGNDRIVGSAAANAISAGGGDDVIIGNGGADVIVAGAGDDVVQTRDGIQEAVACGDGNDTAIVDEFDTVSGCESIQSSREFQTDVDADGVSAPTDCNDRDPAVKPGATDVPHNNVDEDCSGADAVLPIARGAVVHAFQTSGRLTRVVKLEVLRAPAGSTVQIACTGSRCPFKTRRLNVTRSGSRVDLARLFRKRPQATGGSIEVRVLESGHQGRIVRFRMRTRRAPATSQLCLPPGGLSPSACPAPSPL